MWATFPCPFGYRCRDQRSQQNEEGLIGECDISIVLFILTEDTKSSRPIPSRRVGVRVNPDKGLHTDWQPWYQLMSSNPQLALGTQRVRRHIDPIERGCQTPENPEGTVPTARTSTPTANAGDEPSVARS